MKIAAKRSLFLLILLGGLLLVGLLLYRSFQYHFLYLDFSEFTLKKILFFALTVLLWIGAAFCFTFVMYHADSRLLSLLLPMLLCLVMLLLGALLFRITADRVLCSYTTELSSAEAMAPDALINKATDYYDEADGGRLTGFAYYEYGENAGEERTYSFDEDSFPKVLWRIDALGFWKSKVADDTVYELSGSDGVLIQIRVNERFRTITFGRYIHNDALPEFAPHAVLPEEV